MNLPPRAALLRRGRAGTLLLAVLAYVPLLLAHRGRVPTDTKLYLYLDPGRLIRDAPFSWDTRQFGGWVPHQAISYLWPSGPWYWTMQHLGVPDWVAQRLWVGTILLAAGLGVRWAARHLGLSAAGATAAALVYMLSPHVLPYVSRTSVMLLPWAAVGWLVGLTIRIAGELRWRDVAWFALVVATVGGVNVTATAMIAPAPLLWLAQAGWTRAVTWRRIGAAVWRIGAASIAVSLWWIVMISTQGRYGAAVLGYSETLEAVSTTATGPEVLRGMGYWLFYVRDRSGPTTASSTPYLDSPALIAIGLALLLLCVLGLVVVRWTSRWFAAALVAVGVLLAVGVHPIHDPSPLTSGLAEASRSTLALALRSSTRAVALSSFGLALGAGALVSAISFTTWRWRSLAAPAVGVLAVANLPALFTGDLVDPGLLRDQHPPMAWIDAAAALDAGSLGHRVLQLPGTESQAFTWGYTVDPPLPGLTEKQLVTRDWLPLGSPAAMDLLYAFDDRFQRGVAEPSSVAPLARLLGVDTIWLAGDADSDRFGTATPDSVRAVLAEATDVGEPTVFGDGEVELYPVVDPQAIVRARSTTVLLSGSGDGVVDTAAAGVLDGTEAVRYTADLDPAELTTALQQGSALVVTDSNRDRAHQWRGSQHVWGFTEEGGDLPGVLRTDSQDQRLPVFATSAADTQTTARLDGGLTVRASSYGDPLALRPQFRAAMAVDGDAATAWRVGINGNPVGEYLVVSGTDGALQVLQPAGAATGARIASVTVTVDGVATAIDLDDSSFVAPGQRIDVPPQRPVEIAIRRVAGVAEHPGQGVGFAELGIGAHPETVYVPDDALRHITADTPLTLVFTRLHDSRPTDTAGDEEPVLRRGFTLPVPRQMTLVVTLRSSGAAIAAGCTTDLLSIDGTDVPLLVDADAAAALAAGRAATVMPCDTAASTLAAGEHRLVSADAARSAVTVDRVVMRTVGDVDAVGSAAAAADPSVTVRRSRTTREITVDACPTGCWLMLGEGASPGWHATADGTDLGEAQVVSGFAAWWLPPHDRPTTVVATWAPQRMVTVALALSAVALLACLALVWRDRSPARAVPRDDALLPRFLPRLGEPPASWRATIVAAAVALGVTAVGVSPRAALWLLPVAAVITVLRRPWLWRWLGLLLLLRLTFGMLRFATRAPLVPRFDWPLQFEPWHRLSVVAVIVLLAGALPERRHRGPLPSQ